MKKLLLFTCFCWFAATGYGQTKLCNELMQKYNNNRTSNVPVALFVQGDVAVIKAATEKAGGVFKYSVADIAAVAVPLNALHYFIDEQKIFRIEDNSMQIEPMNDLMLVNNNVAPVHAGASPLPQGYDGFFTS